MKQEILDWMEDRRKAKPVDEDLHQKLNNEVRKMCKQAKEKYLNKQCDEIEVNPRNMHQKIKDIVYKKKIASGHCIKAKNGSVLIDQKDIHYRRDEYIAELYKDDRGDKPSFIGQPEIPVMLKCEVVAALKAVKKRKAVGPDIIATEMTFALNVVGIEKVTKLANVKCMTREYNG